MDSLSDQRARLVDDMDGEDFVIHAAIWGPDAEAAGQMLKENIAEVRVCVTFYLWVLQIHE